MHRYVCVVYYSFNTLIQGNEYFRGGPTVSCPDSEEMSLRAVVAGEIQRRLSGDHVETIQAVGRGRRERSFVRAAVFSGDEGVAGVHGEVVPGRAAAAEGGGRSPVIVERISNNHLFGIYLLCCFRPT